MPRAPPTRGPGPRLTPQQTSLLSTGTPSSMTAGCLPGLWGESWALRAARKGSGSRLPQCWWPGRDLDANSPSPGPALCLAELRLPACWGGGAALPASYQRKRRLKAFLGQVARKQQRWPHPEALPPPSPRGTSPHGVWSGQGSRFTASLPCRTPWPCPSAPPSRAWVEDVSLEFRAPVTTGTSHRCWERGRALGPRASPPPAPFPAARRRCCCWAPPRWPASPWTSSSCSSTPSGCAAGGARARSTWTPTAAAPPGASSSPPWSAGERGEGAGPGGVGAPRGPCRGSPREAKDSPARLRGPALSQRRHRRGFLRQWGDQ